MWSLIASAASSASGILILLAVVGSLIGLGGFEQHRIDANALTSLKASYAAAQAKAVAAAAAIQKQDDDAALTASTNEAAAQAAQVATLQKELSDVSAHVHVKTITASCVPLGLVRVLYAGSHGVTADSLSYGAGQSDDACAAVGWSDLASAILHDYSAARANGEQLTALQTLLKGQGVKVR